MGTTVNRGYPYPEYTDPQDVRQNIEDLAEAIDTDMATINNQISLSLNAPTVSVFNQNLQAIAPTTQTTLSWTNNSFNNDAMWDLAFPTIITFQTSGIYMLSCMVALVATGTATPRDGKVEFVTSGAFGPNPCSKSLALDQQSPTYFTLMVPYPVTAAGETLSVRVIHDHTAALNVNDTRLNVTRLGRTSPL